MNNYETALTIEFTEGQSPRITGIFKDATGTPIPAAALSSLTFTLYDEATGPTTVINSRAGVNVLNANGGTVDASGNFALQLTLLDQVMVNPERLLERHVALIKYTTNAGQQGGIAKISWLVRNERAL